LRVSTCAERRFHHFWIMIDNEKIDMMASTTTIPFAKGPIDTKRSTSERFIVTTPQG
jgi:hypothetical protein